tara:strand:+ start:730 stop:1191 length:462 start_codon:yes stop_codon:yes gene_type:complete
MSTIRKIFYVNTTDRAWYKIVVWWEIRRILYNAILILFGFCSYQLTSLLPDSGYFKLYAGPVLVVWTLAFLVLFFVFANICYTSGWIFQILTKKLKWKLIKIITVRLYIFGLIISLFVTFMPFVLEILNIILPDKFMEMINSFFMYLFNIINS